MVFLTDASSPCACVQVGCFDPYSDDPRLGIQKISLCKYSNKLVVAGTAGQVKTWMQMSTGSKTRNRFLCS